ncbi:PREDICTED: adenylate kinase 8-like [Polistes canadensis]|uniref:adenylate kinase 8-like n=1 Tax=Polistes canadensis TaxID=91411 RepID=UPI000718C9BC|nr:PREDICTED: adenylate kinase 8-like [Polistes canadensis]
MCDFVDAIKRPLSIPPRFIAYLEKHKIYELFQELAKQLIIDQPEDHILYMKQCLEHAVRKRDIPRIILLAPPIFDKMALAEIFRKELGLQPITVEDLREKIINKNYVKKPECLRKGWVLTNYPVTVEDFKLLDMIDTPPNKVIFVQVSEEIRKERLLNRRYNIITGSKHSLISCDDYKKKFDCELGVHPKDYVNVVIEEIREYDNNVGEMLEYAGESAFVIDGNTDEQSVRESVEGCLMQSKMYSKPREPQPTSKIDLRDVEFDPDDEPDISIFDTIMPPEFKYSFI